MKGLIKILKLIFVAFVLIITSYFCFGWFSFDRTWSDLNDSSLRKIRGDEFADSVLTVRKKITDRAYALAMQNLNCRYGRINYTDRSALIKELQSAASVDIDLSQSHIQVRGTFPDGATRKEVIQIMRLSSERECPSGIMKRPVKNRINTMCRLRHRKDKNALYYTVNYVTRSGERKSAYLVVPQYAFRPNSSYSACMIHDLAFPSFAADLVEVERVSNYYKIVEMFCLIDNSYLKRTVYDIKKNFAFIRCSVPRSACSTSAEQMKQTWKRWY